MEHFCLKLPFKSSVVLPPASPSLLCLLFVTPGLRDTWMYPVYVHVINLYVFLIFSVPLCPLSFKPTNVHKSTHPPPSLTAS